MHTVFPVSRFPARRLLSTALTCAAVALPGVGHAQQANVVQRSFINLGFEAPVLAAAGCRLYITEAAVPGWTTTHPAFGQAQSATDGGTCTPLPPGYAAGVAAPIIELWRGPRSGGSGLVPARNGQQFAELNAEQASRIFQNVCLEPNDVVRWSFSHRGRASETTPDVMRFLVGASTIATVSTTNTGGGPNPVPTQGTATGQAGPNGWRDYAGTFTYVGARGTTNIGFEAISTGTSNTAFGNFLDDIQVFLTPFIELTGGTYRTVEGASTNLPTLRIAGTLDGPLEVILTVTGGTAVLGTDFTTPGGSATFTVAIPAGTYEGDAIPLGLQTVGNAVFDGTRTVQLQLEANESRYFTRSTSACGQDGITAATWEILDDDIDLSMAKTVSPPNARPGDTVAYTLVVTNNADARVDADGALVRDPAVSGLDCAAAVPVCSATAGATCPAEVSMATLQGGGAVIPVFPPGGRVEISFSCQVMPTP